MKKLLGVLIAFVMLFAVTRVKAMTEAQLKDVLTQTIKVGGDNVSLSDGDKVLVERYLDQNEVSEAHADYINTRVEEAISIIKAEKKIEFKQFTQAHKDRLKELVGEISSNTTVKATLNENGLIVYNSDGRTVFAEVTHLVKQTGEVNTTVIIAGIAFLVVAAGSVLVVKQAKGSN